MRIVTGSVVLLMIAAWPAAASEVFIAQPGSKAALAEQAAVTSVKTALSSAMLALPLQPNALNLPAVPVANAGTNASLVMQTGANNFAAVTQSGGGNASSIVQRGNGNQAIVTQRNPH
jgi:hypothetical protein